LWLGWWDLPAEIWAGFREHAAVLLLDNFSGWCEV
jgi:hypothetical protein